MTTVNPLVSSLLNLKDLTSQVHEALHDQEHYWESAEYHKLEKVWDKANREVWDKIHHKVLRRLYDLDGKPEGVADDIADAYKNAISSYQKIHDACQSLYDQAEQANDYVTLRMLMKIQTLVEEWIDYFNAKQDQAYELDRSDFMSEQM